MLDNGYACLMDFRFAKPDEGRCRTLCGTLAYVAPEMVRGEVQGPAADWWSLGVLLHELACGQNPFEDESECSEFALMHRIATYRPGVLAKNSYLASRCSGKLLTIVGELLTPSQQNRVGSRNEEEVRGHAFFQDVDWDSMLKSQLKSPLEQKAKKQLSLRIEKAGECDLGDMLESYHEGSHLQAPISQADQSENELWLDGFG
ncbi:MAG: hypothetical protein SGPRY_003826 [Prymnesium sp.]